MGEAIALFFSNTFKNTIGKMIGVFIISMLPIVELRGSIPVGYLLKLNIFITLTVSIIGNMLPIPFILLYIDKIFKVLRKINFFDKIITKLETKAYKKKDVIDKYGYFGLLIFVAIPLPGTGAWTAALLAYLMKMDKLKSFIFIFIGVLLASLLVSLATYGLIGSIF